MLGMILHRVLIAILTFVACVAPAAAGRQKADLPMIMRALVSRAAQSSAPISPRISGQTSSSSQQSWSVESTPDAVVNTKQQYIRYLKTGGSGSRADCRDRFDKFNGFFRYDSTLGGQIEAKETGSTSGRLDNICDFLGYAHWCFALGFAYAVRDLDDSLRVNGGNKCLTYQEFCSERARKTVDSSRVDEYLSRIIDEITFYYSSIRNTSRNTATVITETTRGQSLVTSTSYKVYDTDKWVQEQVSTADMAKLLCR
jgi:hypothetical protein